MDRQVGYKVTGFRTHKGELAECKVGDCIVETDIGYDLRKGYQSALTLGEDWAEAEGEAFLEYHIEPLYRPLEETKYVPFDER